MLKGSPKIENTVMIFSLSS